MLLEQELVGREVVQEQVCPVILHLTTSDAVDEFKTEAVAVSALLTARRILYTLLFTKATFCFLDRMCRWPQDSLKRLATCGSSIMFVYS